jgi:predicted nucleotidyltransferase component of viral defense system
MLNQLLTELQNLINAPLFASIGTALSGVGIAVMAKVTSLIAKSKDATSVQVAKVEEHLGVFEKVVNTTQTTTAKDLQVVKAQNDTIVAILTTMITHSNLGPSAISDLTKLLAIYKNVSVKNVDKVQNELDTKVTSLSTEVAQLANKIEAQLPESLVGTLLDNA